MEYIYIYDKIGRKLDKNIDRELAHKKGLLHKAVHVWILNDKNELLLQRRSPNKKVYPNMFDISFAGHVSSGEDSIDAIIREGKEEIGIDIELDKLDYIFSYKTYISFDGGNYIENEIDEVFIYRDNIKIEDCTFMDNEVTELKYINYMEFEKMWKEKYSELVNHEEEYMMLIYILKKTIKMEGKNVYYRNNR